MTTCINLIAKGLESIGYLDSVEVLVTDWNSNIPLHKALSIDSNAIEITRFIVVPPEIASEQLEEGKVFHNSYAQNVALRRANGKFILHIPADTLLTKFCLLNILQLLDKSLSIPLKINSCLFFIDLIKVPHYLVKSELTIDDWEKYLLTKSSEYPSTKVNSPGLGLGQLNMMHSQLWNECRGFNENLSDIGWHEADLALRVCQKYPWISLSNLGVVAFDMGHEENSDEGHIYGNPQTVHHSFTVNNKNWGLGNYDFELESVKKEHISQNNKTSFNNISEDIFNKINDERIKELIISQKKILWDYKTVEWEKLGLTAWYSMFYEPKSYLEFGIKDSKYTSIAGYLCPSIDIYAINSFQFDEGERKIKPDILGNEIKKMGFNGYLRFLTGSYLTAIKRLINSSIGELSIDLAVINNIGDDIDYYRVLNDIFSILSNDGAIICSKSIIDKISLEGIKKNNLNINYFMSESENTILIIKSKNKIQNGKKINLNIYRESIFSNVFPKFKYMITNPKVVLRFWK
tara:strand:+ start:6148 stop:7704 length:1557 start_codon:yes stop_codon:yes gene_type:complete